MTTKAHKVGRATFQLTHDGVDGTGNLDARICNPFNDLQPERMEELLIEFMNCTQIDEIYRIYFRRAMYVAQLPEALDRPELRTDGLKLIGEEGHYLNLDKITTIDAPQTWKMDRKKWNLPRPLWRLVTLCALGALVQGWDEAAVNSAQLYYQNAYNIWIDTPEGTTIKPEPWKVGFVNSAPYLCCVFSCWLTHPLNKYLGRRWTIFISCFFSALFALTQAFADSWPIMFTFRFLLGLGIGPKSATIPIYASEASPQNVRGGLVMLWQVFTAMGIMCGYIVGVAFQNVLTSSNDCPALSASHQLFSAQERQELLATRCSLKWRLMIGSPMVAPIILMMYIFTQPESPRWLIAKAHRLMALAGHEHKARARYQEAFEALMKLRHTKLQAARDMFLLYFQLLKEKEARDIRKSEVGWYQRGAFELVTNHRNRRALIASLTCMFAQQFCGVNVIIYYSSEVLRRTQSMGNNAILLLSMGFGIINFTFALPAFYTIDTIGRRTLLLLTFPILAVCHLLTALAFVGPSRNNSSTSSKGPISRIPVTYQWPLAVVGMYGFGMIYSFGEGPVPFVYSAESMPLYIRDLGMGAVTSVNWFFNWLIAFTAPNFFETFRPWGAFLWYAVWCVILWFMIFLLVPETRILSLEQLDSIFDQSSTDFVRWAIRTEAKWFVNKCRRKPNLGPRPQLYKDVQKKLLSESKGQQDEENPETEKNESRRTESFHMEMLEPEELSKQVTR